MDLSTFYAVVSATCFTLVGLWWSAVDRRRDLLDSPEARRLVGGVYLTFLLPGVMGLFAQVAPAITGLWRTTFGLVALIGAWSTFGLIRADRDRGPAARSGATGGSSASSTSPSWCSGSPPSSRRPSTSPACRPPRWPSSASSCSPTGSRGSC